MSQSILSLESSKKVTLKLAVSTLMYEAFVGCVVVGFGVIRGAGPIRWRRRLHRCLH